MVAKIHRLSHLWDDNKKLCKRSCIFFPVTVNFYALDFRKGCSLCSFDDFFRIFFALCALLWSKSTEIKRTVRWKCAEKEGRRYRGKYSAINIYGYKVKRRSGRKKNPYIRELKNFGSTFKTCLNESDRT